MIFEFNQLKKDKLMKKVLEHCREFEDYYEYCLIDEYEEKYGKFHIHSIQLGDVFIGILEEHGRHFLVSLQFFKEQFSLTSIGTWIDKMAVYFEDKCCTSIDVQNAGKIVDGLRFRGRPIVMYEKGYETLSYELTGRVEVSDVYKSYDFIVNSANATEVGVNPPCKATIFYNGERVYFVPRIEFDLTRDLIVSNGQVIVSDYIEDYCGTVGFWQDDNDALPVTFFYDDETPIYINIEKRSDGSQVCVIEQKYIIQYEKL